MADSTQPDDLTQNPIALNKHREARENVISRNDAVGYVESTLRENTNRFWPTAADCPYSPEMNRRDYLTQSLRLLSSRGQRFTQPLLARAEALGDYLEACGDGQCAELVLKPDTAPADDIRVEALAHYGAARELTATGVADLFAWTEAATEVVERRNRPN